VPADGRPAAARAPRVRLARTRADLLRCFPVLKQLRPRLVRRGFVDQVARQGRAGYRVCFLEEDGQVRCVAGFRVTESLHYGRFLYVDDLVADEGHRSRGHGAAIFAWLVDRARAGRCRALALESGVQRHAAHRFYHRQRMSIACYHFALPLEGGAPPAPAKEP
jgi:GNAT superfamily N-acetyltransferase